MTKERLEGWEKIGRLNIWLTCKERLISRADTKYVLVDTLIIKQIVTAVTQYLMNYTPENSSRTQYKYCPSITKEELIHFLRYSKYLGQLEYVTRKEIVMFIENEGII